MKNLTLFLDVFLTMKNVLTHTHISHLWHKFTGNIIANDIKPSKLLLP